MAAAPFVSAVIPVFNRGGPARACAVSLLRSVYPSLEVIIVNDGSTDDTSATLHATFDGDPRVRVLDVPTNLGSAVARNIGAEVAHGDYLLFVDSDTRAHPRMVSELVRAGERHPDCGLIAPLIRTLEDPTVLWFTHADLNMYTGLAHYRGTGTRAMAALPELLDAGHTPTCWMLRRDEFFRIGGHEERYGMVFEETDIAHQVRTRLRKRVVLVPAAALYHDVPVAHLTTPFFRSDRRVYLLARNRVVFMRKNATRLQVLVFFSLLPALVGYSLITHLRRGEGRYAWLVLKGTRDGLVFNLSAPPPLRPSFAAVREAAPRAALGTLPAHEMNRRGWNGGWIVFAVLFLASTRVFFLQTFDGVGHNWDWNIPTLPGVLAHVAETFRHGWWRTELGIASFLPIVFLPAAAYISFLNLFLPVKWTVYALLLTLQALAFGGFRKLLDDLVRPSPWNALPALLYAFSPFLFSDVIGGSWVMWTSYAVLPLYVRFALRFLSNGGRHALVGAVLAGLFIQTSTQYTVAIHAVLLIPILAAVFSRTISLQAAVLRSATLGLLILLSSATWVIGYGSVWKTQVRQLLESPETSSLAQVVNARQSLFHIFTLTGYADRNLSWHALHPAARIPFTIAVAAGWLGIVCLLVFERQNKLRPVLPWLAAFLLLVFLVKGANPPLEKATMAVFRALPAMAIFRSPQHLMVIPAFITPILLAFAFALGRRAVPQLRFFPHLLAIFSVLFWTSSWWTTGDFGSASLLAQERDHLDFYRLAPDARAAYENVEKNPLEHRVLFLPTVYSPRYLDNAYQRTAQGEVPEYSFLRHPTLSAERHPLAASIDSALCAGNAPRLAHLLRLLNVGEVIARRDVVPWHTACRGRWDPDGVERFLRQHVALGEALHGPTLTAFTVKPDAFQPLIVAADGLFRIAEPPSPELATQTDVPRWTSRPAVILDRGDGRLLSRGLLDRASVVLPGTTPSVQSPEVRVEIPAEYAHRRFALHRALRGERSLALVEDPRAEPAVTFVREPRGQVIRPQDPVPRGNLLTDSSFESGPWQAAPADCHTKDPRPGDVWQELITDAADGRHALELGAAEGHAACTSRTFPVPLKNNRLYKLSFAYAPVEGELAQYSYNTKKRGTYTSSDTLRGAATGWQTHATILRPPENTDHLQIFFYAPAQNAPRVVVRYDNVRLEDWGPQTLLDYALVSVPDGPLRPPENLSFRKISPTRYRIRVSGARGGFPVIFSESFNAGWRLYLTPREAPTAASSPDAWPSSAPAAFAAYEAGPEDRAAYRARGWVQPRPGVRAFVSKQLAGTIQDDTLPRGYPWDTWFRRALPESTRFTANGYANGWWINPQELCARAGSCLRRADGALEMELIIDFWPQRLISLGFMISAVTITGLLVSLVVWRRRPPIASPST